MHKVHPMPVVLAEAPSVVLAEAPSGPGAVPAGAPSAAAVPSTCLPPSQFIFWHIMKTGGLAVDTFLECTCAELHCAIRASDPGNSTTGEPRIKGAEECAAAPSVMTTHGTPGTFDDREPRGSWASAVNITIMRDPVARVWSYYAYGRRNGFVPFLMHPLAYFLKQPHVDFGARWLTVNNGTFHPHQKQLFNDATRFFGSGGAGDQCGGAAFGQPVCGPDSLNSLNRIPTADEQRAVQRRWFTTARARLGALDYIGLTEKLDDVPRDLAIAWPKLGASCALGHDNPTDYAAVGLTAEPDAATRKLIEHANWMDVMLYAEARVLAARQRRLLDAKARRAREQEEERAPPAGAGSSVEEPTIDEGAGFLILP